MTSEASSRAVGSHNSDWARSDDGRVSLKRKTPSLDKLSSYSLICGGGKLHQAMSILSGYCSWKKDSL